MIHRGKPKLLEQNLWLWFMILLYGGIKTLVSKFGIDAGVGARKQVFYKQFKMGSTWKACTGLGF